MGTVQIKKLLVLSSSRADFGIYLPLLKKVKNDPFFHLEILAFGSHLSKFHGHSIDQINEEGFKVDHTISSLLTGDGPVDIATSFSLTSLKFAEFWKLHKEDFDCVIVLGDRFEMAAAVIAGIPFNIRFAHLFGGETTLGAIDNIYRDLITLASKLQFVSLPAFKERVGHLINSTNFNCHVIGSLSLDNLAEIKLLSTDEFYKKWQIDLNKKTVLITVHPETVAFDRNSEFATAVFEALSIIGKEKQLVVTMPNADTAGTVFRKMFEDLKTVLGDNVFLVENFGIQSYFTCMKYAGLMIGNTSSGITEAASFSKYVLNLGDRQKGRLAGDNVLQVAFDCKQIVDLTDTYFGQLFPGRNIYLKGSAADNIISVLKGDNG